MFRAVVVIPVYNHSLYLPRLVDSIVSMELPCILVDDASNAECAGVIDEIGAKQGERVAIVRHANNQGKGGAVMSGIRHARDLGYTHAVQIDADGQHTVSDTPRLLQLARVNPDALVTGQPVFDESVPKHRLYLRYLTHVMVSVNTLTFRLRDAMCGFRVYPVARTLALDAESPIGRRMDFDIEVLVRLDWAGTPIVLQPTRVQYPLDGISHFQLWADNVRITRMHTRLFFGMLVRSPSLLFRRRANAGALA